MLLSASCRLVTVDSNTKNVFVYGSRLPAAGVVGIDFIALIVKEHEGTKGRGKYTDEGVRASDAGVE